LTNPRRTVEGDTASGCVPNETGYQKQEPTRRFVSRLSLDRALAVVTRSILRLFDATVVTVYLTDQDGYLAARRYTTRSETDSQWESIDADDRSHGFSAAVVDHRQRVFDDDASRVVAEWVIESATPAHMVSVPLQIENRAHGLLQVTGAGSLPLGPTEHALLMLVASYAAVAIENAHLHAQEVEAARLDGVRLAARTAADQVGNDIAIVVWMAELALRQAKNGEPVNPEFLEAISTGASNGIQTMQRILDVARIELLRAGQLPPVLDLSSADDPR
jgi:GAF domain-containing protein